MVRKLRWSYLVALSLVCAVITTAVADDVFVQQGVVVKPLSKRKQRRLEKKVLRRPGNEVVIEGTPTATPSPEALAGMKSRRSLRPLFGDRFARRNDVIVGPSVVTTPATVVSSSSTIVSTPTTRVAPGDPQVIPGSVEVMPSPRGVRPPVVSIPRGNAPPVEPLDEPEPTMERPASARILPLPADEIPPPVVSTPRGPAAPAPTSLPSTPPAPAPAPPPAPTPALEPTVDPGPLPTTPPPAPEPEPTLEPTLERPVTPKPA